MGDQRPGAGVRRRLDVRGVAAPRIALGLACCFLAGCDGGRAPQNKTPPGALPTGPLVNVAPGSEKGNAALLSPPRFFDVAEAAGVRFTYRNGEESERNTILESVGGGVAMFDYDGDGRLDLFFPGGGDFPGPRQLSGRPGALFRQRARWSFADVAHPARCGDTPRPFTFGVAVGDVDGDGFPDLAVTGFDGVDLHRNLGDGTFDLPRPSSPSPDPGSDLTTFLPARFATSAAWGDIDGDGHPDLYVARYVDWSWDNDPQCFGSGHVPDVCPPREFAGLDDVLYLNNGDGSFRDGSRECGLVRGGKGLGVLIGDIDLDGDNDLYVANDTTDNFLYVNDGHGRLEEKGLFSGVALDDTATPNGSMGVDLGDYNADGLPDLWVANYEQEAFALYRNEGESGFLYATRETGIGALAGLYVGFGTLFGDFDLDGDEDLVVSNGHVIQTERLSPIRQVPLYLENQNGRYVSLRYADDTYFGRPHLGRGLAAGDLDGDGDLDLAISLNNEPVAVLENRGDRGGSATQIRLVDTLGSRDAVGASAKWECQPGRLRLVKGGTSYLSASPTTLHWKTPEPGSECGGLSLRWPAAPGAWIARAVPPRGVAIRHATGVKVVDVAPSE